MSHLDGALQLGRRRPISSGTRWSRQPDWHWDPPRAVGIVSVVVVIACYAWVAWSATYPVIPHDEINMVGLSRLAAGEDPQWTLGGWGFMPGLALLLAPSWWFTDDPVVVYRAGILLSAAIAVLAVWPLSRIARLMHATPTGSIVIASVVMIAPARLLLSNFLFAEMLFLVLTAFLVVQAHRLWASLALKDAVLFGLLVGAVVLSHGRGVALAVAAGIWCALLILNSPKAGLVAGAVAVISSAGAYVLYNVMNSSLIHQDGRLASLSPNSTDIAAVIAKAIGQLWYATLAWPAVVVVGFILVVSRARHHGLERFLGIGAVISFMLSVAQFSGAASGAGRTDTWFYGRYMDHLWTIFAVVGLTLLTRVRWPALGGSVVMISAGIGALMLFFTVPLIPAGTGWAERHVLGVAPFINGRALDAGAFGAWPWVCAFGVAATAVVVALSWFRGALLPVIAASWLGTGLIYDASGLDPHFNPRERAADPYGIAGLPNGFTVGIESWVGQAGSEAVFAVDQHLKWLDASEPPLDVDAVLAPSEHHGLSEQGAQVFVPSASEDLVLWVLPGALFDWAERNELLVQDE